MSDGQFIWHSRVLYGHGVSNETAGFVGAHGRCVAIISGDLSARAYGHAERLTGLFESAGAGCRVFDANGSPTAERISSLVAELRIYQPDLLVASGGGGVIDLVKLAAAMYASVHEAGAHLAGEPLPSREIEVLIVPSAPGSGAEVTSSAIAYDSESRPVILKSPSLSPDFVAVDFGLAAMLPSELSAQMGVMGLCHAIEAFVSGSANAISDALALDAAGRLGTVLPGVCDGDAASRDEACTGSLMAGMAFEQAGLGLAHGLAAVLAPRCGRPYRVVCGALLPLIMRYNMPAAHEKYAALGAVWGQPGTGDSVDRAAAAIRHVMNLTRRAGIPQHLKALGVDRQLLPDLVDAVTSLPLDNPREFKPEAVIALLTEGL